MSLRLRYLGGLVGAGAALPGARGTVERMSLNDQRVGEVRKVSQLSSKLEKVLLRREGDEQEVIAGRHGPAQSGPQEPNQGRQVRRVLGATAATPGSGPVQVDPVVAQNR